MQEKKKKKKTKKKSSVNNSSSFLPSSSSSPLPFSLLPIDHMLKSSGHGVHTKDGFTYCFFYFFLTADDDGESPLVFFPLSLEEEAAAAAFPSVASLEIIVLFFSLSTFPYSYTPSLQLLSDIFCFFFWLVFVVDTISLLKLIARNRCCWFYVADYDGESPLIFLSVAAVACCLLLLLRKRCIP